MEKQYYAILSRDSEFNTDIVKKDDYQYLTPEALDQLTTRVVFTSRSYKKTYNEFLSIKNSYAEIKKLAEQDTGNPVNFDLEICIVKISEIKEWEILKLS